MPLLRVTRAWVGGLILTGCYAPSLPPPDGARGDSTDVPTCGWPYAPSNGSPCDAPSSAAALSIAPEEYYILDTGVCATSCTLDSDSGPMIDVAAMVVPQADGPELVVIHLEYLEIGYGAFLSLTGPRPVAFLVNGAVELDGPLLGLSGADSTACLGSSGGPATGSGGGGGGGFGALGGEGGNAGGLPGSPVTAGWDRPLRGGCDGGAGSGPLGMGGRGGLGGGAVQVSSATEVRLTSSIVAFGGGGAGGMPDHGGGGGGSGGAIIVEAPSVVFATGAILCATGGSGGEGGDGTITGSLGAVGPCNGSTAQTVDAHPGGNGGAGASLGAAPAGQDGGDGPASGGGGGGSVGWIRLRASSLVDSGVSLGSVERITPL